MVALGVPNADDGWGHFLRSAQNFSSKHASDYLLLYRGKSRSDEKRLNGSKGGRSWKPGRRIASGDAVTYYCHAAFCIHIIAGSTTCPSLTPAIGKKTLIPPSADKRKGNHF